MSKCESKKSQNPKSKKTKDRPKSKEKLQRITKNGEQTRKPRGTNQQDGTQKDRGTGGGAQETHGQKQVDNRTETELYLL